MLAKIQAHLTKNGERDPTNSQRLGELGEFRAVIIRSHLYRQEILNELEQEQFCKHTPGYDKHTRPTYPNKTAWVRSTSFWTLDISSTRKYNFRQVN